MAFSKHSISLFLSHHELQWVIAYNVTVSDPNKEQERYHKAFGSAVVDRTCHSKVRGLYSEATEILVGRHEQCSGAGPWLNNRPQTTLAQTGSWMQVKHSYTATLILPWAKRQCLNEGEGEHHGKTFTENGSHKTRNAQVIGLKQYVLSPWTVQIFDHINWLHKNKARSGISGS